MSEAVRALALLVDSELDNTENVLSTLASSPAITADDLQTFCNHTRRMAPVAVATVAQTNAAGEQVLNTCVPFGRPLPKGGSNLIELRVLEGPQATVVSALFFAPKQKRFNSVVQIPVVTPDA